MCTAGSLGDLYPVLSTALSLEDLGVEVRLLLSPDDCEVARSWGLLATPVGPTRAQICAHMGQTEDALAEGFFRNPLPLLRGAAIPALNDIMPELQLACVGAACVTGTFLTIGGAYAAEKAGLPYVPLILQPYMVWSALAPPRTPEFAAMIPAPRNALTRGWNRSLFAGVRGTLRLGLSGPLDRLRADMGLPPLTGTPLLDSGEAQIPVQLGLWSDQFASLPADAPANLMAVGFPRSPPGDLPRDVQTWIDAGPPPLVVTLGSVAQGLGGTEFYAKAINLARMMGLRVIVLHGKAEAPVSAPDILARPSLPHAPLFPQAAALLHHGGMGTTAEALRSGRPQLVMPIGGDQPDNAARLVDLDFAVTLRRKRFSIERALPLMRGLLERFDYVRATELGRQIAAEDGARQAAIQLAQVASLRPAWPR